MPPVSLCRILIGKLMQLGFRSEERDRLAEYEVSALRPDYFLDLPGETGVILEVERGKTLINNMDLLDIWKCHLCRTAHYLWLLVPQQTLNRRGLVRERPYRSVLKRAASFFTPATEVDIRSLTVFGY